MSEDTNSNPKSRWTKCIAQSHIEAQQKSGLSKPIFCQQAGIDYKKFLTWARKIQVESDKISAPIQFLPVSIKAESQERNSAIEIVAKDGHRVRVGLNFGDCPKFCV